MSGHIEIGSACDMPLDAESEVEVAQQQPAALPTSLRHEPYDNGSPLHRQVALAVRRRMESGELPVGSMLPPEIELARQLGVSRHTMRAGLDALVREGLLERRRGRGTMVVRPRIQQSLSRFYSVALEMRSRGARLATRVLARGRLAATDELAEAATVALGIDLPADIGYVLRLRLVDEEPLLLETLTFPAERYPWLLSAPSSGDDPAAQPFYDEMARRGGPHVTRAHEVFRPVAASSYEARLLQIAPGAPVFQVDRTSYAGDAVAEWRRTLARGDRYVYAVDLANPAEAGLGD